MMDVIRYNKEIEEAKNTIYISHAVDEDEAKGAVEKLIK